MDLNKDGIVDLTLEGNIDYYTGYLSQANIDVNTGQYVTKKHSLAGTGTWEKVFLFDKKRADFAWINKPVSTKAILNIRLITLKIVINNSFTHKASFWVILN
jgi:hypothetical protein